MALRDPSWINAGEPDLAIGIFPNKRFEGQVDAGRLLVLHQCSATFWITKNHYLGWAQRQSNGSSASGVIDACEDGELSCRERRQEMVKRLARRKAALH